MIAFNEIVLPFPGGYEFASPVSGKGRERGKTRERLTPKKMIPRFQGTPRSL